MSGIFLLVLRVLSAIALYTFLVWTLLLLWRMFRQETLTLAARKIAPLSLNIECPDQPAQTMTIQNRDVVIGREQGCEVFVAHSTVSARHARLTYHHSQWWVDDLQSTNGTFLNDEPLQMPTVVVNGDTIKCGQVNITILLQTETAADTGES